MDSESKNALALINSLEANKARLQTFLVAMKTRCEPRITGAGSNLIFSKFPTCMQEPCSGAIHIEAHAEIKASPNNKCVWWELDLWWSEACWFIEAQVGVDSDSEYGGTDSVINFPDRTAETLSECISHIDSATTDLISSGDAFDILQAYENK